MSADNGIYILQSKDGFRVAHAQAIENIYWWPKFECDCSSKEVLESVNEEGFSQDVCKSCGGKIEWEDRGVINPTILSEYFGNSKVFATREEALAEADRLYRDILDGECPILEYGISFIRGWEVTEFPKES